MSTPTKEHQRSARLREYDALVAGCESAVAVMGILVRARESRAWNGSEPPEVAFAQALPDDLALPAAVWVALRRDDIDAVLDALTAASDDAFLISRRDEMGPGFRIHTVNETKPRPALDLLRRQMAETVGVPADVLEVLGEWGAADPRTGDEIETLLDARFGAAGRRARPAASHQPIPLPAERAPAEFRPADQKPTPIADAHPSLDMSVDELADVLQLSAAQAKVLQTLVRKTTMSIRP